MNLAAYFVQAVRRFPEAVAVVDEQVRWSYRDLYTEVTAVAAHLQQRGLAPGDHVLVSHPQLSQINLRPLTKIGYAGAAMTSTLTQLCFERLQPKVFVNHFGSSEVYTFTICSWLDRKPTCAGRPGFHEDVRIVTADPTRKVLPDEVVAPGVPGEVIVSLCSPEAFHGYWQRP